MKNLFIIGLISVCLFASIQASASNFVCDDWEGPETFTAEHKTFEGTLFSGKKTGNRYKIKNIQGTEIELVYIGEYNTRGIKIYSGVNPTHSTTSYNIVSAYAVWSGEVASELLGDYDFEITRFNMRHGNDTTKCKFE